MSTENEKNNLPKPSSKAELKEVEEALKSFDSKIFKGINNDQKRRLLETFSLTITEITEQSHSGPIPDPESLEHYNNIIPNGADRIMQMAEKQQQHRFSIENKAIKSQTSQSMKGQIFGFIISLFCIIGGIYLTMNNYPIQGGGLIAITVSITAIFVIKKLKK